MAQRRDEKTEKERAAMQVVAGAVTILALILGAVLLVEFRRGAREGVQERPGATEAVVVAEPNAAEAGEGAEER